MILEALMITIIYPTFFTKTCNKLLSQSKSNYDKDTFHQIEKSIEIAKKTVIYVTTIIDIASLIFNFIFIYKANSST